MATTAKAVIGIHLDVSGSMEEVWDIKIPEQKKIRVIFDSIKNLVNNVKKSDLDNTKIFVEVFGLRKQKSCDLIFLLDLYLNDQGKSINPGLKVQNWISEHAPQLPIKSVPTVVEDISNTIERYGTGMDALKVLVRSKKYHHVMTWLPCIENEKDAMFLYCALIKNPSDMEKLANMISPIASVAVDSARITNNVFKGLAFSATVLAVLAAPKTVKFSDAFNFFSDNYVDNRINAKGKDSEAYRFAMKIVSEYIHTLPATKLRKVEDVIDLLNRFEKVTTNSVDDFFANFQDVLYGNTPLQESMRSAASLFETVESDTKVLFVLSDGESTDGDPTPFADSMRAQKVTIVTCFLTAENIAQPRKLFCHADKRWSQGERTLYNMSSERSCFERPLSALQRSGWALPAEGDCKLFVRVNSPEVVKEFCSLVFNPITSQTFDVAMDVVANAVYSDYVNSDVGKFRATDQDQLPICYAHAIAAVFVLAMSRIIGRVTSATDCTENYPTFEAVKNSVILRNAKGELVSTSSQATLERMTATYRLNYEEVDEIGVRNALLKGRPVVVRFWLNKEDWATFSTYFAAGNNPPNSAEKVLPEGKLTLKDCRCPVKNKCGCGGHAVVLIRCSKDSLTFLNSWGDNWADRGLFKIASSKCLGAMKFYDVFWRESDLFPQEKINYEKKKSESARAYVANSDTLLETDSQCPDCRQNHKIREYKGTFDEAICPKGHHFQSECGVLKAFLWMSEQK